MQIVTSLSLQPATEAYCCGLPLKIVTVAFHCWLSPQSATDASNCSIQLQLQPPTVACYFRLALPPATVVCQLSQLSATVACHCDLSLLLEDQIDNICLPIFGGISIFILSCNGMCSVSKVKMSIPKIEIKFPQSPLIKLWSFEVLVSWSWQELTKN